MGRHSENSLQVTKAEVAAAYQGSCAGQFPEVMTVEDVARMFSQSVNTIYHWKSEGRLNGTFFKLPNSLRFWRERLVLKAINQGLKKEQKSDEQATHEQPASGEVPV